VGVACEMTKLARAPEGKRWKCQPPSPVGVFCPHRIFVHGLGAHRERGALDWRGGGAPSVRAPVGDTRAGEGGRGERGGGEGGSHSCAVACECGCYLFWQFFKVSNVFLENAARARACVDGGLQEGHVRGIYISSPRDRRAAFGT
jgi:hypothetical protein